MIAEFVPAVPPALLFVVSLAAFAAFFALLLLRYGLVRPIQLLLKAAAEAIRHIWIVGHPAADALVWAGDWLDTQVGDWCVATEKTGVRFFNSAWKLTQQIGDALYDLAASTEHAVSALVAHAAGLASTTDLAALRRGIDRIVRHGEARARGIEQELAAAEGAIVGGLTHDLSAAERRALRGIDRLRKSLTRRLTRLERLTSAAALAAAVVAIVAKEWPHLRCKNNKTLGKHLCGWPVKAFEDLLAGVVGVLALFDACRLLSIFERAAEGLQPLIVQFTLGINKLARCRHVKPPPALPLRWQAVPPNLTDLPL